MTSFGRIKFSRFISWFLTLATLGLLGFFLYWRFQMALRQHFDLDEYAYLHWVSHYVTGSRPYRDFLFIIPPAFLWYLLPAFWFFPPLTLAPVFAGRVLEYGAFLLLAAATAWLFWELRKSWLAVATPLILVFLPLPSIKFIEIRPDTLAMALLVFGMVFVSRFLRDWRKTDGIALGIFYALSLLVVTKMVTPIVTGLVVIALASRQTRQFWSNLFWVLVGFLLVGVPAAAWMLSLGWHTISLVIYNVVQLPLETAVLGKLFSMQPNLFFYPNDLFYGSGSEIGRFTNHALWLAGLIVCAWRIVTPFLSDGKRGVWQELLVGGTMLAQLWFFTYGTPYRHSQYLIPLAVWVAWYFTDGLYLLWQRVSLSKPGVIVFAVLFVVGLGHLYRVYTFVQTTRLVDPMDDTFQLLTRMWKVIPTSEYVFDLEGITLYYPDPYYACCLPFGQTQQYFSRPLPNLVDSLEQTKTNYIYQGTSRRLNTLQPADRAYIEANFGPWEGHPELLVRQ